MNKHEVKYVVIGGVAATFHGSPVLTQDADICPAKDQANLEKLARSLKEMGARVYAPDLQQGLPWTGDSTQLSRAEIWNLVTKFGRFDIAFSPSGTQGYEDLAKDSVVFELEGIPVPVASLRDVIRSKEAAGRLRDRQHLPTLRKLLERLQQE